MRYLDIYKQKDKLIFKEYEEDKDVTNYREFTFKKKDDDKYYWAFIDDSLVLFALKEIDNFVFNNDFELNVVYPLMLLFHKIYKKSKEEFKLSSADRQRILNKCLKELGEDVIKYKDKLKMTEFVHLIVGGKTLSAKELPVKQPLKKESEKIRNVVNL